MMPRVRLSVNSGRVRCQTKVTSAAALWQHKNGQIDRQENASGPYKRQIGKKTDKCSNKEIGRSPRNI